jgi:predicted phosphodiesterase
MELGESNLTVDLTRLTLREPLHSADVESGATVRLGILSDTNNELAWTRMAVQLLREEGAEALVHCGDLTSPPIVAACAVLPCWFVFGNHDADNVPALQEAAEASGAVCLGWAGTVELEGYLIAVAHGHVHYDVRRALASRPHYLFSGHSHVASDRREGLVRRINPGALHEADRFTVALLDLRIDDLRFLTLPVRGSSEHPNHGELI